MATIVRTKDNPSNLGTVDLNAIVQKDIEKYFNNFTEIPVEVSSNVDAAIVGFFESLTNSKEAAKALASAVIYTSVRQGLNPMDTLSEFTKLQPGELDAYTTIFLNFNRVGTSYLGIKNSPKANKYVQRAILP